MVDVVQLAERQIVVLVVVGSNPIVHPFNNKNVEVNNIGVSPSGKASDFDSDMRRFKSCHPSQ